MTLRQSVRSLGSWLLQSTRYPTPLRRVLNSTDLPLTILTGADVDIGGGCQMTGTVRLEDGVTVGPGCTLRGDVTVGDWTTLNGNDRVIDDVRIGKYCAVAEDVIFQGRDHSMDYPAIEAKLYTDLLDEQPKFESDGPIRVGNDVWIGTRAIVLNDVTIGDGAVVAAGSIVTDDVEPYSVVAGVPAEHKRWRHTEAIREQLLDIEWWDWDRDRIRRNTSFFNTDLRTVEDVNSLVVE